MLSTPFFLTVVATMAGRDPEVKRVLKPLYHAPSIHDKNDHPIFIGLVRGLLLLVIPVVVSMLLIMAGDVEQNPGPETGKVELL